MGVLVPMAMAIGRHVLWHPTRAAGVVLGPHQGLVPTRPRYASDQEDWR
jgi:hypothetical protein